MELFSLLAKLTLDTKEYDRDLESAKKSAKIELPDARLGIDTSDFEEGIREAENTDVDDPTPPDLGLDKSDFDATVTDAEATDVKDPADPDLGLDKTDFDATVTDAEATDVKDPEEPSLGLDTQEFKDGVSEAEETASSFSESIQSTFTQLEGALAAAGITAAVAGVVNFLKEGVELAKNNGDAIDKQSQKLNLSAKAYQELDYALTLSGASIGDLTRAMRNFTEISGGKTTDDQAATFEKLGISATDASGKVKSAQELMEESMYALADYGGEDRGLLTEALFGKNSAGLNALLNSGSEAIKGMRQEANELGLVMSDEEIKNAAAYMDATTRLEKAVVGIKEEFASGLIPLLTDAANTTAKIVAFFNGRNENSLAASFAETDSALAGDLASIEGTSGAAMDLIDKLFAMGDANKLNAEQQDEWKATADWLIKNIPTLSDVINKDTLQITANKDEVKATVEQWERLAKERAIASAKEAKYKAMVEKNADAIDAQAQARQKENDRLAKYYERVAAANALLEKYGRLSSGFQTEFGTTKIDASAENAEDMIAWISRQNAFLLQESGFDNSALTDLNAEYTKLGYAADNAKKKADSYKDELDQAQEEYEGWLQAIDELYGITSTDADQATKDAQALDAALDQIPDEKRIRIIQESDIGFPQAKGNDFVPYDNYPSLLHRGEMVLTASEASRYRAGTGSGAVDFTGLEDKIIAAIKAGMANATVRSYLNGKDITDEVNREMTSQERARRFR